MWEARVGGRWGWLAATEAAIGYLSLQRWLQCIDPNNGAILWEQTLGNGREIYGRLVGTDDYLLAGGWRGYTPLRCLDLRTGTEIWQTPDPCEYALIIPGPWGLAIPDLTVGELLLVEPKTGVVQLRIPLPEGVQESDHSSSVQRYGSLLLATTKRGDLLLIDPVIDRTWRTLGFYNGGIFTVQPTLLGDWVLFQDTAGQLCAFDLAAGRLLWSSPLLHRGERVQAVRLPQGQIVIGTSEGRLEVRDDQGNRLAARTVGKRIHTTLGVLSDALVVFGTSGEMVAYQISQE